MDFNRLTEKVQEAIQAAQSKAVRLSHQQIDVEHLLAALIEQENGLAPSLLLKAGVAPDQIHRRDFIVTWGMIARVPLFAELDAAEISDIMQLLRAQVAEAGQVIVRAGDPAHSMYFIASGEVEIAVRHERLRLGVGQFFGEVAVLRRARRSATVTALSRTSLLVLDAQDLHALMQRDPRVAARIKDVVEKRVGRQVTPKGDIVTEEIQ